MSTIFKLVKSYDEQYLAALTLEGEVIFIDPETEDVINLVDFNSEVTDKNGITYKEENTVLDLGFTLQSFKGIPQKTKKKSINNSGKKKSKNFLKRNFMQDSAVMTINNGTFSEFLIKDGTKTWLKKVPFKWEKILMLPNMEYGDLLFFIFFINLIFFRL